MNQAESLAKTIIDRYYSASDNGALYMSLWTHSRCVARKALDIASHCHLDVDMQFVELAALLHDIGIIRCHAPSIHCHGSEPYIRHGIIGADMLRSLPPDPAFASEKPSVSTTEIPSYKTSVSYADSLSDKLTVNDSEILSNKPSITYVSTLSDSHSISDFMTPAYIERIARVCERHTGSGLTTEDIKTQNLPLPHRDFCPETIEEKLICYADKFFSKSGDLTAEKPIEKIEIQMTSHGAEALNRFLNLKSLFSE